MEISVIVCLLVILLAIWIVSVRKKLAIMDENINQFHESDRSAAFVTGLMRYFPCLILQKNMQDTRHRHLQMK